MDADGDFVIAFENHVNHDGDGWGIYARRYDNTGASQGGGSRSTPRSRATRRHRRWPWTMRGTSSWPGTLVTAAILFQRYDSAGRGSGCRDDGNHRRLHFRQSRRTQSAISWSSGRAWTPAAGAFSAGSSMRPARHWHPSSRSTLTKPTTRCVPTWRWPPTAISSWFGTAFCRTPIPAGASTASATTRPATAVDGEFLINTTTAGAQYHPAVANR